MDKDQGSYRLEGDDGASGVDHGVLLVELYEIGQTVKFFALGAHIVLLGLQQGDATSLDAFNGFTRNTIPCNES